MTEVAHGEVRITLTDRDAIEGLHRVQAEYQRTMAAIDKEEAVAKVDANIKPFERKVQEARRELRRLEGERAANAQIGADDEELKDKIKKARLEVKRLDGTKATVELKVEGERRVAEAQKRLLAEENKRAKAVEANRRGELAAIARQERADLASERARMAALNQRARVSKSLRDQEARELSTAHAAALRMDRERTVGVHRQAVAINKMQREYAKLTDQAEKLARVQRFTKEGRAKLELDTRGVAAKMLALKAELNALGAHPPVDIKVDIARTRIGRIKQDFGRLLGGLAEKAAGLSAATVRLGPFTTTIKGLGAALAFLGPTLFDIIGALGSLVSVAGSGLAGAMAVGSSALQGFAFGMGGLLISTRNVGQEMGNARLTINAYQKAVEKYGKTSDQAKKAQDQMNNTLKAISPVARESALGIERFYNNWDKHTQKTQKSFGNIAHNGFKALDAITPMWAASTNRLASILDTNLRSGFKFLRGGEFKKDFQAITGGFNAMVPSLMRSAGNISRAFLNVGREGAKYLPQLGRGIEGLSKNLLKFTQRKDFSSIMADWVKSAQSIGHFFAAATATMGHFFGAGVSAGRDFVDTMTNALKRWNAFIKTDKGREKIGNFFQRSVDGAQQLYAAVAPLIGLFAKWATGLQPAVQAFTKVFSVVTDLLSGLGKLVGLGNPIATIGATIGAAFAIGKIGAFVAALARIPSLLREINAASGAGGVLRALGTGALFKNPAAGAVRGAESIVPVGALGGAARTGAAMEKTAASAGRLSRGLTGAKAAAGGLVTGLTGLNPVLALSVAGLGGGAYALYKSITATSAYTKETQRANEIQAKWAETTRAMPVALSEQANAVLQVRRSALDLHGAQARVNALVKDGKKGSEEYKYAMLDLRQAEQNRTVAMMNATGAAQDSLKVQRTATLASQKEAKAAADAITGLKDRNTDAAKAAEAIRQRMGKYGETLGQATEKVRALSKEQKGLFTKDTGLKSIDPKDIDQAAKAFGRYNEAVKNVHRQQELNVLATLNLGRATRGLQPIANSAATAFAAISRQSKSLSRNISLKFTDSGEAGKVAASASRALKSGVPKQVVTKIVVQSKDAENAIERLNSKTAKVQTTKTVNLNANDTASAKINGITKRIDGVPASKNTNLTAHDGASGPARNATNNIKRIPGSHSTAISARDNASGVIGRVLGLIRSLPASKTTVLTTIHRQVTQAGGRMGASGTGHGGAAGATGGLMGIGGPIPPGGGARIDRAFKDASSKGIRRAFSQKINSPQLLVGEERSHPEFVVATNPVYKKRNLGILAQAASALGAGVIPAAMGFSTLLGPGGVPQAARKNPPNGKPMTTSKKRVNRKINRGVKSGRVNLRRVDHPWVNQVNVLDEQQGLWQQEVSFREGNVQEPEDFLVEKHGDPTDPSKITGYEIDTAAVQAYKSQLESVLDALKNLMQVINQLMTAIPMAFQELTAEIATRGGNISQLDAAIDTQHSMLKAFKQHNKKGKYNKEIKQASDRINRYQDQRRKEVENRQSAGKDKEDLKDHFQSTSFDQREGNRDVASYTSQIAGLVPGAGSVPAKALAEANASLKDPSGGTSDPGAATTPSSGVSDLSYGAQVAASDVGKAQLYRDFGSNTSIPSSIGVGGTFDTGGILRPGGGIDFGDTRTTAHPSTAGSTIGAGVAAARASGPRGGGSGGVAVMGSQGDGGTIVNLTVNNSLPPADPHTWSKGVAFELGSAV